MPLTALQCLYKSQNHRHPSAAVKRNPFHPILSSKNIRKTRERGSLLLVDVEKQEEDSNS
ncbi:Uncharacterized protein DAT39_018750, partial [Clarias magur]